MAAAVAVALAPFNDWAPQLRVLGRPRRNPVQPPAPRPRHSPMVQTRERRYGAEARRVRQIARGMLTICNGLVVPGLQYLGHGYALHVESGRIIDARM